jgi:hypothetical protein
MVWRRRVLGSPTERHFSNSDIQIKFISITPVHGYADNYQFYIRDYDETWVLDQHCVLVKTLSRVLCFAVECRSESTRFQS